VGIEHELAAAHRIYSTDLAKAADRNIHARPCRRALAGLAGAAWTAGVRRLVVGGCF